MEPKMAAKKASGTALAPMDAKAVVGNACDVTLRRSSRIVAQKPNEAPRNPIVAIDNDKASLSSRYESCEQCCVDVDCWSANIYILTKDTLDRCLCEDCFHECEDEMKEQGWECDDWDM
jgi:hypothetical protein